MFGIVQIPEFNIIQALMLIAQLIFVPILLFIAKMVNRAYKQNRLQDFKHEALIYSIQENLADNGFSKDYYNRLNQLMKEHNFIYEEKKQ